MTPSKFWSALALKHLEESGTFYGYASVFNVTDQQKERVAPGAFRKTLEQCHQQQLWPKLLWQHDPTQPIGTWIDIREDNIGLFVHGKLLMSVQKGLEAHALLKAQALNGLSIGFTPVESHIDVTTQCRVLTAVNLHEISLVTYPANQHKSNKEISICPFLTSRLLKPRNHI
jgi:HK97 family phage prohead protease